MGINVHVHLAVHCDRAAIGLVRELAAEYRPQLPTFEEASDLEKPATLFLDWLASDKFHLFEGNGGDLLLWGFVRGYVTYVEEFVRLLSENGFWVKLLKVVYGNKKPYMSSGHILVFEEYEQTEETIVYEIKAAGGKRSETEVTIKRHKCSFCFNL